MKTKPPQNKIEDLPTVITEITSELETIALTKPDEFLAAPFELMEFGDYEIESEIGRGAMGRVYKAWDPTCERFVALKTIHPNFELSRTIIRRLLREGNTQKELKHKNIVEVFKTGEEEGIPFIVSEFIENAKTLSCLLGEPKKPLAERRAVEIILEIAKALEYSHEASVIHRDIKPSNIMMDGKVPKLTDFGLAFVETAEVSRISGSGDMLGTISYMSPEQVRGSSEKDKVFPNPQWDIYSLGATFYELVTGKLPFAAPSPLEVIRLIQEEDPPPLSSHGIKISNKIEAICIKCLEKSPENRYHGASELIADLIQFLEEGSVKAAPVHWGLRRIRKTLKRIRTPILIFCTLGSVSVFSLRLVLSYNYAQKIDTLQDTMGNKPPETEDFSLSFLKKAINEPSLDVRMASIRALARLNTEQGNEVLFQTIQDPEAKVRFHLAATLLDYPTTNAQKICEHLIQDSEGIVVSAAINLAREIHAAHLLPRIKKLTYSNEKIVRAYALTTTLEMLGKNNGEFIENYLLNGPSDGNLEILNRLKRGQVAQPIGTIIGLLGKIQSPEVKNQIVDVLTSFTNADFGPAVDKWKEWWTKNKENWHTRHCLALTWAPSSSKLKFQDIIWEVDGNEVSTEWKRNTSGQSMIRLFRNGKELLFDTYLRDVKAQSFFIGTIDDRPVGDNGLVNKIALSLK